MRSISFKSMVHGSQVKLTSFSRVAAVVVGGGDPSLSSKNHVPVVMNCHTLRPANIDFSQSDDRTSPIKNTCRDLGKEYEDKRLVISYLEDYPGGLTVCEFISKIIIPGHDRARLFLKYRPRFSELNLSDINKVDCPICKRKEYKYKL